MRCYARISDLNANRQTERTWEGREGRRHDVMMRQKKCDSLKQQKKVGRTDKFSLYVIGVLKVKSLL